MPVDTSAAQSAQNLLNGIDYSALIGGPLQAAIKAQAMAAQSTYEFIERVGLTTDKEGVKQAINVTFLYQKDGQLVKLIVPLLTIVPIPLILVDEVSIQFKANINASASSTTEDSSSENIAGELEASGKIGWGPFSLQARFKASYSSKKDSKATQDSRYSVEYTQDVMVHASQAGVPAGLATVLNILSNAATGASRDGELQVSPAVATTLNGDPMQKQVLQIKVLNSNGLAAKKNPVIFSMSPTYAPSFKMMRAPIGTTLDFGTDGKISSLQTGDDGSLGVVLWMSGKVQAEVVPELTISTDIPVPGGSNVDKKEFVVPINVIRQLGAGASLTPAKTALSLQANTSADDNLTALKSDGTPAANTEVTFKITDSDSILELKSGTTTVTNTSKIPTGTDGSLPLNYHVKSGSAVGKTATVEMAATIEGTQLTTTVKVTVAT
jgi:hypothetical protein